MRLFDCCCGNTLYFDNTLCTACGRKVGWCAACHGVQALEPEGDHWRCTACAAELLLCANYASEEVCNRTVLPGGAALCDCCELNATVPDMNVAGNREKWARLEAAKRRLIFALDRLGLPHARDGVVPLSFAFMGDPEGEGLWRAAGEAERVYTGHAEGLITINIREADPAEREQIRVDMGEAHRTLIGHFRHEIGHYYWDLLVRDDPALLEGFVALFGDPQDPPYGVALERHYAEGPPADWAERHVSAYASMHPWEDWAETWALYLDIASVLDTAVSLGLMSGAVLGDLPDMLARYRRMGRALNELNREMGLLDFAPAVISGPVEEKLAFVHRVVSGAGRGGFLDNGAAL
ncbi:putative zinc-binding peptidase [Pseudooceanicola sp. CBS1P-1]|uniref:Zinc-ribbon domain-containing protein n=1 Tax=Pseudooceanicola albus TaxID=2692189 RepID=A0A6L7G4P1_9RHOB|nr:MULTISPECIES: putative zinc-binding metallopeptidase [Pseudooceanicola]MBT9384685.1 putative zinc-binding peptidase [Pseudooceanicola endophyticus]MXN18386.1 hypothetical protein [Pseudooceanicola albus]